MSPAEPDNGLASLEEHLNLLLSTIQNGNWEGVANATDEMQSLLDNVRRIDFIQDPGKQSVESLAAIQRVISLLETAMESCGERQQQIAPLLDALAKPVRTPPSP